MLTRKVAGRVYNFGYCIGRAGIGGAGFYFPQDFAIGSSGSLYVVNKGSESSPSPGITKCTIDHQLVWEDRGPGFCEGRALWPISVDTDSEENVYVSDDGAHRIFVFSKDGGYLTSWGSEGSGDGELNGPSGLAFDQEDSLYVVNSLNHRVQKFTMDGKFLAKWGSYGSGPGQFELPWGIAIDKDGNVYVADWKNDRVQKFTPDGQYLSSFGQPGPGEGDLRGPTGVAIDSEGDVYVTDWGNDRVNIYAADGTYLTDFVGDAELSPWGEAVLAANPDAVKARQRTDLSPELWFNRPVAVNVDDEGRIMVLETGRHRIQVYVKERNFVDAQFNL